MRKSFGSTEVLRGVSLHVPTGAFHVLLGPSGSGKTTLLKVVAGFTPADGGRVELAGEDITQTPAERRNIGVVFQNYALFPHMTVAQNVGFGLRMRRVARAERAERVGQVLRLVHMEGYGHRRPAELSGGQQQRVALARALVIRPRLLLLDEPLSALDRKIRQELREELKRIQAETGVTTLMVTHDQEEALSLADRVLVMDAGVLRQSGPPTDLYRASGDAFVAGFLGAINLIDAEVSRDGGEPALLIGARPVTLSGELRAAVFQGDAAGRVRLAVRPEQLVVAPADAATPGADTLDGTLVGLEFGGPVVTIRVRAAGQVLQALALSPDVTGGAAWAPGQPVRVRIRQAHLVPPEETG